MTNHERAEKMVRAMLTSLGDYSNKSYYDYFLSQLDEAVKEAMAGAKAVKEIAKQALSEFEGREKSGD